MERYELVNGVYVITLDNGDVKRVAKSYIDKQIAALDLNEEDAVLTWLEDMGYMANDEQDALEEKAKMNRVTASIHKAEGKTKAKRKVERKANPDKEALIAGFAEYLEGLDNVTDVVVENIGKIVTFKFNGKEMKIDLVEKRVKKDA